MKKLGDFFDRILDYLAIVAMVLIVGNMLLVVVEVVMRYFFDKPVVWVIEITQYALVFMTFLATAWLLKREGHVIMDLIVNRLNEKGRHIANMITSFIAALVCLIITA